MIDFSDLRGINKYPKDLLRQSILLLENERSKPLQSSLRRSISTAYYAVFHSVSILGTSYVYRSKSTPFRSATERTLNHAAIKNVAKKVSGDSPKIQTFFVQESIPDEAKVFCRNFLQLQESRHIADYDLNTTIKKAKTKEAILMAYECLRILNDMKRTTRDNLKGL